MNAIFVLRRVLAVVTVVALGVATYLLLQPWHTVGRPSAQALLGAFYVGPDYHVSGEERAALLRPTIFETCRGVDHLHPRLAEPLLLAAALVSCGLLALPRVPRRTAWLALIPLFVIAPALGEQGLVGGLFAHLFETVGPSRAAESWFGPVTMTASLALAATSASLLAARVMTTRAAVRRGRNLVIGRDA